MESPPKLCSFLYISYLILFLSPSFLLLSSASTSNYGTHKVSLKLYYESLCPYSANFIVNYLVKLFDDDLISIVDLSLVPYGNARVGRNDSITCQVLLSLINLNFCFDWLLNEFPVCFFSVRFHFGVFVVGSFCSSILKFQIPNSFFTFISLNCFKLIFTVLYYFLTDLKRQFY